MNHVQTLPQALIILGPGRVGQSIAKAATVSGSDVQLMGRDFDPAALLSKTVLVCVPDAAIGPVADRISSSGHLPGFIGHTSGATTLDALAGCHSEGAFSLHPLQTVPTGSTDLAGCPAACAGSSAEALAIAAGIASALSMKPFEIAESDRAVYHAAASIASNYLVTLEQTAAELLGGIGVENPRAVLAPLVRRTLSNWEERGATALTGPIVRGDENTVEVHRRALEGSSPEVLPLYDTLAERTRALVAATGAGSP